MNDLDLITKFRADAPPADPDAMARARARMFHSEPPRRTAHWVRRIAPVGALAAAVVVTTVVVRAHGSHDSPPATPPASEAVRVLRLAAAEARSEPTLPARADQFVYVESEVAWAAVRSERDGKMTYLPPVPKNRRIWQSVDGSRPGLLQEKTIKPGTGSGRPPSNDPTDAGPAAYLRDPPTTATAMRA